MRVRHDDPDLERLEADPAYEGGWAREIVRGYRKALLVVRSVTNETELGKWRSLNFEKLKGKRSHQWSLRVNDQYRVVVEIEKGKGSNNNCIVVKELVDYHE